MSVPRVTRRRLLGGLALIGLSLVLATSCAMQPLAS
ncbi:twin-arginine translocation signal domain-containing protein [Teichococcus wenyumeiae]